MELEVPLVLKVRGWEVLRTRPASGRGRGAAACRSWAACPGRSASRKEEEEEGRWGWERRRGGAGTLSSSGRISHPPLPPSTPRCLQVLQPSITRSRGGSCAPCTRSITSSKTGRRSVGTRCRRYTRGEPEVRAKNIGSLCENVMGYDFQLIRLSAVCSLSDSLPALW